MREQFEKMASSGQYGLILEMVDKQLGDGPVASPEQQWAAVMACRAAACVGKWGEAVDWATRGLAFSDDDSEAVGWLNLILGTGLMFVGDVYRCDKAFASFEYAAAKAPALQRLIPDGLYNRAFLMRFLNRPDEELQLFTRAARLFDAHGRQRQVLQSRLEIAWTHLINSATEQARCELEAADDLLERYGDPELQHDAQIQWALYYQTTGQHTGARKLCQELWNSTTLIYRQRADVAWILGCNARSTGDLAGAAAWAGEAYRNAIEDWWPLQIQRIDDLRKSVASQVN